MAAPEVCLEVVAGKATGTMIVVEDELMIGRHAEGFGRLSDDQEISRLHARVTLDGSGFCAIEDLGSTNGTFVNGLRISTPQTLSDGDTVELGDTTLVVRRREAEPAETPGEAEAPAAAAGEDQRTDSKAVMPPPELPLEEALEPPAAGPPAAGPPEPPAAGPPVPPPTETFPPEVESPEPSAGPSDPLAVEVPAAAPLAVEAPSDESPVSDAPPPSLGFRVDVDFAARTTVILLDDGSPPIRLAFSDGAWRQVPPGD